MIFETEVYSRVLDSWIRERVLGRVRSWTAPLDVEEQAYFDFLHRERRSEATGEPDYRYSWLDKLLTRIHNGTIERGVRYFAQAQVSPHWRFTEQLVNKIDYVAWQFLRDYLPQSLWDLSLRGWPWSAAAVVPRSAVCVRCSPSFGTGKSMASTSTAKPSGQRGGPSPTSQVFNSMSGHPQSEQSAQQPIRRGLYDGILDHSGKHRAVLANVYAR